MSDPGSDRTGPAADPELLAMIVHDLRSPLTTIVGWAELLALRPDRLDAAGRDEALDAIRRSAGRAATLLDGLAGLLAAVEDPVGGREGTDVAEVLGRVIWADRHHDGVTVRADPGVGTVPASVDRLTGLLVAFVGDLVSGDPGRPIHVTVTGAPGEVVVGAAVDARVAADGGGLAREVTRRMAAALGGRLVATTAPGEEPRLVLRLPSA